MAGDKRRVAQEALVLLDKHEKIPLVLIREN